ncbi:MAG: S8 family serine peptidase [Elusimicrobia bacterium]|nr:S8 family serine peptidase [Elusimicrobiota bacterium]
MRDLRTGNLIGEGVRGQVVVKFKRGAGPTERGALHASARAKVRGRLSQIGWELVELPPDLSVEQALELYRADPNVENVSPNFVYRPTGVLPNDPLVKEQYALARINAPGGWEFQKGASNILIAVVDTGVDTDHPDLSGKLDLARARSFTGGGVEGTNVEDVCSGGHGTLVAGIASASTDNGFQTAGVSWNSKVLPIRVFDSCAGADSISISSGVLYAVGVATTPAYGYSRAVINLSLGISSSGCPDSQVLTDAVNVALGGDVVVVASAGNQDTNCGLKVRSPANIPGVIAVGATDDADLRASFSAVGSSLSVVAPGVEVLAAANGGGVAPDSGTSFSAPHVAGLAALILAANVNKSTTEVKNIIEQTADDLGPPGTDDGYGRGRINVFKALRFVARGTLADFKGEEKVIAFPNPFRLTSQTAVSFAVPASLQGSNLEVLIYTVNGEKVRTLKGLSWDGRNDAGNRVASGTYIYLVQSDRGQAKGRIAIIK